MNKLLVTLFAFFTLFLFSNVYAGEAQSNLFYSDKSVQLNAGLIAPLNSSKGFITNVQFNYKLNETYQFYIYAGYSQWDKYNVRYHLDTDFELQNQTVFSTYTSDSHRLIPVYAGTRINFYSSNMFTSFVRLEMGYSYLSYMSYNNLFTVDANGAYTELHPDKPGVRVHENLIGVAAGAGISYPLNYEMNLILSYKINSFVNMKDYTFLHEKSVTSTITVGLEVGI